MLQGLTPMIGVRDVDASLAFLPRARSAPCV